MRRRHVRRGLKETTVVQPSRTVAPERTTGPALGALDGHTALLLDGAVQSLALEDGEEPAGYWPALLPERRPGRTLLLGLGGGTVVRLLQRRFAGGPALEIVGVDDDPRVLAIARQQFGIDRLGITVVQVDAADFLRQCRERGDRFDLVIVDLFRDGAVPSFVCGRSFLAGVAAVLVPDGLLSINLNRGERRTAQLRRLSRLFLSERLIGTGMNLVVHARAKQRRLTPSPR